MSKLERTPPSGNRSQQGSTPIDNVTRRKQKSAIAIDDENIKRSDNTNITHKSLDCPMHSDSISVCQLADTNKICYEDFARLLESKLLFIEDSITKKIKNEINLAVEQLQKDFTCTTDFLAAEQKDLKDKICETDKKIKNLEMENNNLCKELAEMGNRLRSIENISRSCNIEIQALPETKQEDLLGLMNHICTLINLPLVNTDIRSIRRVARIGVADKRPRNILVTFFTQHQRDNVLTAFKKYNKNAAEPLNTAQLNILAEKHNVYIVEHLSPEMKKLYADARKVAKRELSYSYVWVKHGRIYVRKTNDSAPIQIKDHDCLRNL